MKRDFKRVCIYSDPHSGHRAGLTPPQWQYQFDSTDKTRNKYAAIQFEMWKWLSIKIKTLGKIDVLICNGDAIDGKGDRSGGTEQLESSMIVQSEMAVEVIKQFNADTVCMTYGTPYHAGKDEDFEAIIASAVNAEIKSHLFLDVNGLIFDCKHKVSGSIIPHGRLTGINRDALWNTLWSAQKEVQPNSDIIVRSHVHYYAYSESMGKACLITPALMGFGSKYGARQCSGIVDIGFVTFDVWGKDRWTKTVHMLNSKLLRDEVLIV